MKFVGMKPPEVDVPLIEFETISGEVIDLYNEGYLKGVRLDAQGLALEFERTRNGTLSVEFRDVRDLRVEQPRDWDPEEATQIEHILIRSEGPWPGVMCKVGGLDFEFNCALVRLVQGTA